MSGPDPDPCNTGTLLPGPTRDWNLRPKDSGETLDLDPQDSGERNPSVPGRRASSGPGGSFTRSSGQEGYDSSTPEAGTRIGCRT